MPGTEGTAASTGKDRSVKQLDSPDHVPLSPAILYFGTPVALISSTNPDGGANLAPMSSVFWLGQTAVLGLGTRSQTSKNLRERPECVINLPDTCCVTAVDRLALTTGADPVPEGKAAVGYRHVPDKFGHAGLTAIASDLVGPPRVAQCPVALEGRVMAAHAVETSDPEEAGSVEVFEVRVLRVQVYERIRMPGTENRIDPDRWRPLVMSFQKFYGLGEQVLPHGWPPRSTRSGTGEPLLGPGPESARC